MKFLPLLFLVASITTVLANGDDDSPDDRNLKLYRRQANFRIRPQGDPEIVTDNLGRRHKRARIDIRNLDLTKDEDELEIQLMSDEDGETLKMKRDDTTDDPFQSWFGTNAKTGHSLTMVKTTTASGKSTTTGTMYGKNGTVYQIRTLGDSEVIVDEVKQEMFDPEFEGPETEVEGDADVDSSAIDKVDVPSSARRNLRRLDSPDVIDIMVSLSV